MKYSFIFTLLFSLLLIFKSSLVYAEDTEQKAKKHDESSYELMSYADDGWWDVAGKTGSATATAVKNFFWMINIVLAQITLMIVYHLFSLDVVSMTKEALREITSGTAGSLLFNFGTFALAIASLGIVIRSYIQQNWQAFFKLLTLILISLTLLFSIQSKKFNYIDLAHGLSVSLENAIMSVNPSLNDDDAFRFDSFNKNTAKKVSIEIQNKVFDALIYKPYLLLQYGTTQEKKINAESTDRIKTYLNADPRTEEGVKKREEISKDEYTEYDNKNIFAGNGWKQAGYILVMILSTVIQVTVFFSIALIRVMLQFAFIVMLLLAPFMIFTSLFPSFEALVGRYLKGTTILILFKSVTMFFVLVATSFISLGYEMTNMSDDIYYRIFIQITFCVAVIFMYTKRQFVLSMLEGATPSLNDMGAGPLSHNLHRQKKQLKNAVSRFRQPRKGLQPINGGLTGRSSKSSGFRSKPLKTEQPINHEGKTAHNPNLSRQETAVTQEPDFARQLSSIHRKPQKNKIKRVTKDNQVSYHQGEHLTKSEANKQLKSPVQKMEKIKTAKFTLSNARNPYSILKEKKADKDTEQPYGLLHRTSRLNFSKEE
ncbi:CD3337/EF1877 family mobilome membrane protein [Fictibacillus sp. NRS-1165]|uniref:CD3337/EF1877 family mobilome membrane protein n=1 Tax=Fictibacillus sp. NRS-1165 TaxID=3144463 RepID=UPI003D1B37CE